MNESRYEELGGERREAAGAAGSAGERRDGRRRAVKVETVDEIFDFDAGTANYGKIPAWVRRAKIWVENAAQNRQYHRRWRAVLKGYRPQTVRYFLPMFVSHLEQYIEFEKKHGAAIQELKDHKIATAREAADIMERLVKDDYADTAAVEEKWGKFPYEKTTYADGSVSYRHLTPAGYDEDMRAAYAKARAAIDKDLRRLGEIIERNMMDW